MEKLIFIIPEKDKGCASSLTDIPGIHAVEVAHKPFDPRGADAETQPFEESLVTVSFDPVQVTERDIRAAMHRHGIHILDTRKGE